MRLDVDAQEQGQHAAGDKEVFSHGEREEKDDEMRDASPPNRQFVKYANATPGAGQTYAQCDMMDYRHLCIIMPYLQSICDTTNVQILDIMPLRKGDAGL
jgi:hypothetical protein